MRTIKLVLQFDGTGYHGWQTQRSDRTVQKTVQDALSRICNECVTLHGSGRTDAGVHALGQTAHFTTASAIGRDGLLKGLNSLLPPDIVIRRADEVEADFHARYSAKSRVYWYLMWNHPTASPFYHRFSWHIRRPLDVAAMRKAAGCLKGVHDFSSFQGADKQPVNPVREVISVQFRTTRQKMILFEIQAGSFLKHMVRNITGTLAEVGRGRMDAEEVREVLDSRDRRAAGPAAPARGLFLKEVRY